MDFSTPYKIATDKKDAFTRVKAQITPDYIAKFKVNADVSYDEGKDLIVASGKGFDLTMKFTDSECQVGIKLSLMLRPFKGTVLTTIEQKLQKVI